MPGLLNRMTVLQVAQVWDMSPGYSHRFTSHINHPLRNRATLWQHHIIRLVGRVFSQQVSIQPEKRGHGPLLPLGVLMQLNTLFVHDKYTAMKRKTWTNDLVNWNLTDVFCDGRTQTLYALEYPALVLIAIAFLATQWNVQIIQTWCVSNRLQHPLFPFTAEPFQQLHFILHCGGVEAHLSVMKM